MKVTLWADYACPFCYIGETNMRRAARMLEEEAGERVEFELRSFELYPDAPREVTGTSVERFMGRYFLSEEAARERVTEIDAIGREAGLDFDYEHARISNTHDAHRLRKLVLSRLGGEAAEQVHAMMLDACFGRGEHLGDRTVLRAIGERAGLDGAEIASALDGGDFDHEVRADERAAAGLGVRVIPHFVIGEGEGARPVSGCMLAEGYLAELQSALR